MTDELVLQRQPRRHVDGDLTYYEGEYVSVRGESRTISTTLPPESYKALGKPSVIKIVRGEWVVK